NADFTVPSEPGELPGMQVDERQLGVVVQHLLEAGDEPAGVSGVAMKAAAQLVVNAATSHVVKRRRYHLPRLIATVSREPKQQLEQHGLRKLRRRAEAAPTAVKCPRERRQSAVEQGGCERFT